MKICKFGGSATCSDIAIENILKLNDDERIVFVFSAIGKEFKQDTKLTDLLIAYTRKNSNKNLIKQKIKQKFKILVSRTKIKIDTNKLIEEYCQKFDSDFDKNYFISRGEYLTSFIMSKYLNIKFISAENVIFLKNNKINYEKTEKMLKKYLSKYKKIIIPGFFACNETNFENRKLIVQNFENDIISNNNPINNNAASNIKLFSRGGSDLTACIVAKCLGASYCEIWTDVDGIYPINPRICKSEIIKYLSYQDLHTMTQYDATVVQKHCAKILNGTDTKLIVKNILNLNCYGSTVLSNCQQETKFLVYKQNSYLTKFVLKLNNQQYLTLTAPNNKFDNTLKTLKSFEKSL